MSRSSREHRSDEFGQPPLGAIRGMDAPEIGSPANITIDGVVERESGRTPPPPPFSLRTAAIALAVMFVLGLAVLAVSTCMTARNLAREDVRSGYTVPVP